MSPRGKPGSGAAATARSGTLNEQQQIIWQGASLNGSTFYRVIREKGNAWELLAAPIGTASTLAFTRVTSLPMCIDALATLGAQYTGLMFGIAPATSLANRSVSANADNAMPTITSNVKSNGAKGTAAVRRARGRVSVDRQTAGATS